MRSPVKLPGPRPTANPRTSASVSPARRRRSVSAPGSRSLILAGGPRRSATIGSASPGRPTASERVRVELSSATIIAGRGALRGPAPDATPTTAGSRSEVLGRLLDADLRNRGTGVLEL